MALFSARSLLRWLGYTCDPMLRLVAYAPDGVRRFPVHRSELIIGSWPECDIHLPYTGVAQRHARLLYDGNELRIEDLGTRKGMLVSGRKVREALLEVLDEIRLGGVTLLVEDIVPLPEKDAAPPPEENPADGPPRSTSGRMIEHLNRISEWVLADAESRTTSEALVTDVLADFGGGALFLLTGELEGAGLKLVVTSDPVWLASGERLLDQLLKHRETTRKPEKKSTRLNSSHANISYAVFCLKKKTKTYSLFFFISKKNNTSTNNHSMSLK